MELRLIHRKAARFFAWSALCLAALLSGCTGEDDQDAQASRHLTIGVSMHFMRDDYALRLTQSISEAMQAINGAEVIVTDANADPPKQLADMENLLVRGVDAIIVVPIDEKAILPAIRNANARGVPVVSVTRIPGAEVLSTIAANGDYENGRASGELLVEATGGAGKIALVNIPYSLWRIDERERGFMDAIAGTDLEIVARQAAMDQAKVQDIVSGMLVANPDLVGIWCTFSNQVVGAADALRSAGRDGVALTGIDADQAILERISAGWVTGTAAQFPARQGELAAGALIAYFRGEQVEDSYEVPVGIVTAGNVDRMRTEIWGE